MDHSVKVKVFAGRHHDKLVIWISFGYNKELITSSEIGVPVFEMFRRASGIKHKIPSLKGIHRSRPSLANLSDLSLGVD
jgi:hypothetical protein